MPTQEYFRRPKIEQEEKMREMSSGSGTTRKPARKRSSADRIKVNATTMPNEIDYAARCAFLNATTAAMNPAPIDTLLESLPLFFRWLSHFDRIDDDPIAIDVLKIVPHVFRTISSLDDSREAAELKK